MFLETKRPSIGQYASCACCCFGFHSSEASIVFEFYSGGKQKPPNFQHHKRPLRDRSVECKMRNIGSYQQILQGPKLTFLGHRLGE